MTSPARGDVSLDRRQFLARCGALGAGLTLAGGPLAALARAADVPSQVVGAGAAIMRQLAFDTFAGLVAFAVPGGDDYSKAQGLTSPTRGGVDSGAHVAIMESADDFLPFPDSYTQALAAGFVNGVSDQPLPADALAQLGLAFEQQAVTVDQALQQVLGSDATVPLSLLFALFLNFEASAVNLAAIAGPFPASPFANLAWADKAKVFERIERADTDLVAALDAGAPEPLRNELSGTLKFVGGTLLEFAGFVSFSEAGVFDRAKRVATARPVGWEISQYMPGRTTPVDGHNELLGYYKHRKKAAGRAPMYRAKAPKRKQAAAKRPARAHKGAADA